MIMFEESLQKTFFIGQVVAQAVVTTPYSLITIRLVTLEAPHADSLHVFLPRNKCWLYPYWKYLTYNLDISLLRVVSASLVLRKWGC